MSVKQIKMNVHVKIFVVVLPCVPIKLHPLLTTCEIITFPSSGSSAGEGTHQHFRIQGLVFYSSVSQDDSVCTPGIMRGFVSTHQC